MTTITPKIPGYVADGPSTLQWRLVGTEVWNDFPLDLNLPPGTIELRATVQLKPEAEE